MSDLVETMPSDKRPNDEPTYTIGGATPSSGGNLQDVYARLDALEQAVFHAGHTVPVAATPPVETVANEPAPSPSIHPETVPNEPAEVAKYAGLPPTPEQIASLPAWARDLITKGEQLTGLA